MKSRITELEEAILYYQNSYYGGEAEISDEDFDLLWDELSSLDPRNPVLTRVGNHSKDSGFEKATHIMKMGSQEKAANPTQFEDWVKKQQKDKFLVEEKLDGASLELQYRNGNFFKAVTRGDGEIGDDITKNALKMQGIVLKLPTPISGAVRGEVIMTHQVHSRFFSDKANCRNAANGLMKRKDGEGSEYLKVICYDAFFPENSPYSNELEKIQWIKKMGFFTPNYLLCETGEEVTAHREKISQERDQLEYDIDGLVIKCIELDIADLSRNRPEKQIAYKFSLEQAVTRLQNIIWSEKGATYTPIGEFDAVELAGTVVRRASLNNPNAIRSLGVKIGSMVVVTKRGEIIPKIEGVNYTPDDAQDVIFPSKCETCGATLVDDGTRLFCPNKDCSKRILHRLEKWIDCLNIMEFGENLIKRLFEMGRIRSVEDIYTLTEKELSDLDRMGQKSAKNVLKSVNERRNVRLSQFIAGFDIEGIGETLVEKLMQGGFTTLEDFFNAKSEDFEKVYGFAETTAKILLDGLSECKDEMNRLITKGYITIEASKGILLGKSFCFTGKLSIITRDEASQWVKDAGGIVKSSVTKDLTYLVTNDGESNSSKSKKAKELGITIMSEDEFMALFANKEAVN